MRLLAAVVGLLATALVALAAVPLGLAVLAATWCSDLVARCLPRRPASPLPPRDTTAASIMVLNWNGRALLERLLPSLRAAVACDGAAHQVIVIDNGSADDSVAWLRAHFPEVEVVQHETNLGFVEGYNRAWHAARHDIVVVLNNDMVVAEDFLRPLLDGLARHPQAFAVSAAIEMEDPAKRGIETGRTAGAWSAGLFKLAHRPLGDDDGPAPCLWAGGGSAAIDRRALVALGGFEDLFAPYYFEDASLSYQAWRRGWFVLLEPRSRVVHAHRASSSRVPPMRLARIQRRNAHLFAWRSFTGVGRTAAVALALPLTVTRMALRGGAARATRAAWVEAQALLLALGRLPRALLARAETLRAARRSDATSLALAHSRHRTARALGGGEPAPKALRILCLLARLPRRDADGSWVQFELLARLGRSHHVTAFALLDTPDLQVHAEALRPHVARLETMPLSAEPARIDFWCQDPPRLRRDYSDAAIRARLTELLATERFDVVQVDYVEMAYALDGLLDGVASIHVVHEPLASAAWVGGGLARLRALQFERRALRQYRRVVCMTAADAAVVRRSHPGIEPVVIENGIDLQRYTPTAPSDAPTLLFVGSYRHPPNVTAAQRLARAILPRVRARVPTARVLLVGADPDGQLNSLRALDGVEVLGFVTDLAACVAAAGCFVTPLTEGGGMRSKVLEALAWGKPIVGTALSFEGIAGAAGEHWLQAEDDETLAIACVQVLTDAALRARLGAAGRALAVARHDAARMAERYAQLHREVADARVAP